MDIILLGLTMVSLIVALIMSVTAWRLMRDEKQRSAARVAALSLAADSVETVDDLSLSFPAETRPLVKAPWAAPQVAREAPVSRESVASPEPLASPASPVSVGFLGANETTRDSGGRQRSLAFAAIGLFVLLSGGLVWMMSGPRGTTAQAMGPNAPLELVSLTHQRQNAKLAVSGLVRNPVSGKPLERLSAVVFLFDRTGTFITSSRANVDFLKLGSGDESPFVVSLDAPQTVARYRVSFRTDEGIVPHVDRRSATPAPSESEQTLTVSAK
jgi:hypothetical protein